MHGAERVDEISRGDADTRTPNSSVGRLRSPVWEHFTITEKVNEKPIKAICIYCRNEFNCETKTNGTSSMKKHLEKEHSVTCTKKPGAHPPNPSRYPKEIICCISAFIFVYIYLLESPLLFYISSDN